MRNSAAGCVALALLALFAGGPCSAEDDDSSRLDRVERELNQLQRQVYRNEVGGGPAPVAPAGPETGSTALDLSMRMDQLETEVRTLTGQLQETQNAIKQLSDRLDKKSADDEQRFQTLEGTNAGAPKLPPSQGELVAPPGAMEDAAPHLTPPDQQATAGPPIPLNKPDVSPMDEGTPQDQYNNAFGLLRQRDLPSAEMAFKAFLQRHPKDPLAPNAQYWLGETYYSRENYAAAAATFAEGYQKFPQSAKAPESLLKLGMSLGNEGHTKEACLSLVRLQQQFPNLSSGLKERADHEREHLGC